MSDPLERAARAMCPVTEPGMRCNCADVGTTDELCLRPARAAILAFLSASDEATVEKVAQIIATTMVIAYSNPAIWTEDVEMFRRRYARSDTPSPDNPIATARAAIAALRECVEEKK